MEQQEAASLPAKQVLDRLNSSLAGLSSNEVEARRAISGSNMLKKSEHTVLAILRRQLKSSLIYLLAFASIFSFILSDVSDGTIIAAILLINTSLGFLQEFRSEQAVAKLTSFIRKQVAVKRDGKTTLLDESLLVPGDIVVLKEGDIIPADCKLLMAENLEVNESQLTGNQFPFQSQLKSGQNNRGLLEMQRSCLPAA
jgi:magnesium-transporting ATPase (P-type)